MLTLLFRLEVESGQSSQVLLTDGLVDGSTALDPLSVVMRSVRPPIRL